MQIDRLRKLVDDKASHLDGLAETALALGDQKIAEKLCQRAENLRRIEPRLVNLKEAPPAEGGTGHSRNPDDEEVAMREVYLIALEDLHRIENGRLQNPERAVQMRKVVQKVRTLYALTLQES
ncbi:hypothetical protein DVR09_16135 (plasmid) [Erythrobacter aureus]|uniref:Uncharacterized protein n=2 Tax=Erythrobacter aureus TaxID=2182384 RepID=A0A345YJ80_9SPHN|nr:hypothetical protein DVR09_16135 [Erythrobacter aureus]